MLRSTSTGSSSACDRFRAAIAAVVGGPDTVASALPDPASVADALQARSLAFLRFAVCIHRVVFQVQPLIISQRYAAL